MLSDSEDEQKNAELHNITINEHYAKAFQYRKEREELDKRMRITPPTSRSDSSGLKLRPGWVRMYLNQTLKKRKQTQNPPNQKTRMAKK